VKLKTLLQVLALFNLVCIGFAQPGPPPPRGAEDARPGDNAHRRGGEPNRENHRHGSGRQGDFYRDGETTSAGESMRAAMMAELQHVPLLHERVTQVYEVQQERFKLQRERVRVADDRSLSPEAALRKFHEILRQEDRLNQRQKVQLQEFVRDAGAIRKQIEARRNGIEGRLSALNVPDVEEGQQPTPEQTERRNLRRSLRMYDFFYDRLKTIEENPQRVDLLNRLFRGGFSNEDGAEARITEQARRRMDEIHEEQVELQGRMQRLSQEVQELREMMRARERNATEATTSEPLRPRGQRQVTPPGAGQPGNRPGI